MRRDKIDWEAVDRAADRLAAIPAIPDTELAAVIGAAAVIFEGRGDRTARRAARVTLRDAGCQPEIRPRRGNRGNSHDPGNPRQGRKFARGRAREPVGQAGAPRG